MSPLDEALEKYIADDNEQEQYYRLVLATDFYVPLDSAATQPGASQPEAVTPLLVEAEGKPYLMLFDSEERLTAWGKKELSFAILSGAALAGFTPAGLNWAINIGSGFGKELVPDEISWLKELAATP